MARQSGQGRREVIRVLQGYRHEQKHRCSNCARNWVISFSRIRNLCRQAVVDKAREAEKRQEAKGQSTEFCILSYGEYVASNGFYMDGWQI